MTGTKASFPALFLACLFGQSAAAGIAAGDNAPVLVAGRQRTEPLAEWRSRFDFSGVRGSADPSESPLLPWQLEQPFYWDSVAPVRFRDPAAIPPPPSTLDFLPRGRNSLRRGKLPGKDLNLD